MLEFEDRFEGPALDERRWLPCYLPQWSSRADAAARYPRYGRIEARLRALDHPRAMVALWMIGLEDEPEHVAFSVDGEHVKTVGQSPA